MADDLAHQESSVYRPDSNRFRFTVFPAGATSRLDRRHLRPPQADTRYRDVDARHCGCADGGYIRRGDDALASTPAYAGVLGRGSGPIAHLEGNLSRAGRKGGVTGRSGSEWDRVQP